MRSEATSAEGADHRDHILPFDRIPEAWWNDTHRHVSHALHAVRQMDLASVREQLPELQIEVAIGVTCALLLLLLALYRWMQLPSRLPPVAPPRCIRCAKCNNGEHKGGHPCGHVSCANLGDSPVSPFAPDTDETTELASARKTKTK